MTQPDPANKFHLLWFSTQRGISNEDGEKSRVYYGKVFRVPRDIATEDARLAIEAREMNDLEERAIATVAACSVCKPSITWLGNLSINASVTLAGIWNHQHTTSKMRLRPSDLESLCTLSTE